MSRIKFKCKGKLDNDSPCDKSVYAKMHTGVLDGLRSSKEMVADVIGNAVETGDDDLSNVPSDWEFTLICSRGHEEDYSYADREE